MGVPNHLRPRQPGRLLLGLALALLAVWPALGCTTDCGPERGLPGPTEPRPGQVATDGAQPAPPALDVAESDSAAHVAADTPVWPAWHETVFDNMVLVPAGPVQLGPDDRTYERVLGEFYIDRTEVTVADYARCVAALGCAPPDLEQCQPEELSNWRQPERSRHPMNCVRWEQAVAYCAWRGLRLPTHFEWEKAARAHDGRLYPWGDEPAHCELAVMAETEGATGCGTGTTAEVGSRPDGASPYGVLDMAGNVSEWTGDPARMREHVVLLRAQGGSFLDSASDVVSHRVRAQTTAQPHRIAVDLGFRCAYSTVPTYLPEPASEAEER
jgi:formylglycine-generating enzyme required for sulfatase activity